MTYLHVFEDFEVIDVPVCLYAEDLSSFSSSATPSSSSSLCEWPSMTAFPTPLSIPEKLNLNAFEHIYRASVDSGPTFSSTSESVSASSRSDNSLTSILDDYSSTDDELHESINPVRIHDNLTVSGPSYHLASLIPSFIPTASPRVLELIFQNTCLDPFQCIALTGCIIERLSDEFYYNWLNDIYPFVDKKHSEIIIVACLVVSIKFLLDCRLAVKDVANIYRRALYPFAGVCAMREATASNILKVETQILKDIDYNVSKILSESSLKRIAKKFRNAGPILNYPAFHNTV